MAIKRKFILPSGIGISTNDLYIVGSTASTNTSTGSLVVTGGAGIGQSVNVGGRVGIGTNLLSGQLNIKTSSAATPGLVVQGAASQTADYAQFFTSTGTTSLSIDKDGKITFPSQSSIQLFAEAYSTTGRIRTSGPMIAYGQISSFSDGVNESFLNSSTLSIQGVTWTPYGSPARWSTNNAVRIQPTSTSVVPLVVQLQNASWTSGNAFEIQNNGVLKFNVDYAGTTTILSTVGSGSTTTGALVVTGGVGIGGSIFGGSTISAADNIEIKSAKELRLNNSGNTFYTGIKAGANASNTTYTFPVAFPGSGTSILQSDTSGILTWVAMTASGGGAGTVNNGSVNAIPFYPSAGTAITGSSSFTNVGTGISITYTAGTSSTSTGALVVTGGVGIGQSVSVGGRLQMFNGANFTAFVSSASGNTVYTLPATSPATGTSVLQSTSAGVLSWVAMTSSSSGNTAQNIAINTAGNVNVFHPILFTPSSLSAGSAVSSDSTISFNPSTEILNVSGLAITSGTASTNTTTGALVVRGGLGVTGQLSFAQASFGFTGITTNPSMSFIGATSASPITLTVLTDNSLNFEGSQGSVFSIDSNLSSGEIFSVSDISGLPIISASAGQTVNINEFGGYTQIGNGSINSSSTSTGSLVIAGGLGFTGNAFIGGTTTISNGTNSTSTGSGSLVVRGGIGITGNAFIGGTTTVSNTTASINAGSGAFVVSGGVGIGQSASIGGRLQIFNGSNYTAFVSSASGNTVYTLPATSPATGTSVLISSSAGALTWAPLTSVGNTASGSADGTVQLKSGSGFAGTSSLFFDTNLLGLRISGFPGGNTPTSSDAVLKLETTIGSFNGSLNGTYIAVNAPAGFTGDLMNLQVNAVSRFRIDNTGAATAGTFNFSGTSSITNGLNSSSTTTGTLTVAGGVGITGNTFVGGTATFTNGTNSSSTTTGALQVRGGFGITGNAFIGGTTSITNTTASTSSSTGALTVSGGAGIAQTLFVGGNISNTNYFYSGGNNFTKSGQAQGDIFLDNNSNDTPGLLYYYRNNTNFGIDAYAVGIGATRLRIVRDLNESTGAEIWSIDRTGVVTQTAWAPGEIIKMTVLVGADLTGGSTTTISTTSDTDVASYSYTPVSSNSYLVIEFTTRYFVVGAAADDYVSRIAVDGAEQSYNVQVWTNGAGGGTRSGTLFPLMARYTNSNTTAKTISATVRKGTTDDNATVYKDTTTVMKITEIGR